MKKWLRKQWFLMRAFTLGRIVKTLGDDKIYVQRTISIAPWFNISTYVFLIAAILYHFTLAHILGDYTKWIEWACYISAGIGTILMILYVEFTRRHVKQAMKRYLATKLDYYYKHVEKNV